MKSSHQAPVDPDQENSIEGQHVSPEELSATESRRVLLEEIRAELETQSGLKKEILNELKPTRFTTQLLEFLKHPVLLLIIGSAFGGWLSSCYQKREWNRQQQELAQKQRIEKKISTRDEVTDSIIEAYSAAESAVGSIFYENAATFKTNEKDRAKEWAEASRKWRDARLKLSQKLDLYFVDPNIRTKFAEIAELTNKKGNSVFVEVNNELGTVKDHREVLNESVKDVEQQSKQYKELKTRIRKNILEMTSSAMKMTRELRDLMQQEIEKEQAKAVTEINQDGNWHLLDSWWSH
jgi:hypothetical protein